MACQEYLLAHIEILIKYGADIYRRNKYVTCPLREVFEMHLDTPYDRVIENYLQGNDINRLDAYGANILHYAVHLGAEMVVDSLLPRADLSVRTAGGLLPVEIAIGMGFDAIAELLRPESPEPRKELPPRLDTTLDNALHFVQNTCTPSEPTVQKPPQDRGSRLDSPHFPRTNRVLPPQRKGRGFAFITTHRFPLYNGGWCVVKWLHDEQMDRHLGKCARKHVGSPLHLRMLG